MTQTQHIWYESLEKINLSLRSFETGNLSADNFKNTRPRWADTWARGTVRWYWSADVLFWQLSVDHNIDEQLVFSWAPKLAKSVRVNIGFPVVRTDGRRSVYGHVITKFSGMGSYGAPPTRALRARVELRYQLSLQCRRILGGRNSCLCSIVVVAIFDFMTVEDWGE